MKTHLFTGYLILIGFIANAQEWKKDRPVSGFTGLQVSGLDLYLTQGDTEKLTLEVKGYDESEIRSTVQNGVLMLMVDRRKNLGMSRRNASIKAYLTFRQLKNLQISGGADVFGQNLFTFENLNLQALGGADVTMKLKANELNLQVSGGADVDLQGSVREFNAVTSGGADLNANGLVAETCTAYAHGGSDMSVNANREITMVAAGASDITYSGSAKVISQTKSGGADITRKN